MPINACAMAIQYCTFEISKDSWEFHNPINNNINSVCMHYVQLYKVHESVGTWYTVQLLVSCNRPNIIRNSGLANTCF